MPDGPAAPAFLTTREVATLLRVRERKVYEMAADGAIPCRRVTGKLLFPRVEVEAWLAGGAGTPAASLPATPPATPAATPAAAFAAAPAATSAVTSAATSAAISAAVPPDVVAGSHDPLLDWAIRESGSGLATLFDGSLDGLDRVAAGRAIAGGMHVLEAAGADWNRGHAMGRAGHAPVALVEWAWRQQGLIVAPDLAPAIRSVADLSGRRVAQRQPSAGAGLLLAHLLERAGVDDVTFLPELARTETDAAAAVASGKADVAPGLAAVARQFGLPFVPTMRERFDLLVDRRAWFEPPMQALLRFAHTEAFAAKARDLGGYDVSGLGTVRWNAP
jgi:excisionase family DNA binding protein